MPGNGGPVVLGSVGYGFGNGLRVELEGTWRSVGTSGGTVETFGGFGNILYDLDIGMPLYPYVGAGVGYERIGVNGASHSVGANSISYGGHDSGLAAQGILGVSFPISGAPGLSITGEYRFVADVDNYKYGGSATIGGVTSPASVKFGDQYNHQALIGLRYAFGVAPMAAPAPAPAPVAAPAPAPARTYLVFFDWDKSDLTARAKQIIAEAAQASTRVAVTRIEVSGYADRTGSASYNQALSVRRGDMVAAELVRLGVNKSAITVQGFGDTHPLVPTGPNTREPQNRRVEIVLK
jgi:outer membrane protein OmpA-like peptidoglycan-associated protein